ncbi:MAG: hypothetical protein P4L61_00920 [Candidatus Pacebacteria bacterium]|nr:hypothetical protein [Candidatus Paceibacterota bacterium]
MNVVNESKVSVTDLAGVAYESVIASHEEELETSYVILDKKMHKVAVKDGNLADMRFRIAPPGDVVPIGMITTNGALYRLYLVSPDLLS